MAYWQAGLRNNLFEAEMNLCQIPSDAWDWATRPVPTFPWKRKP